MSNFEFLTQPVGKKFYCFCQPVNSSVLEQITSIKKINKTAHNIPLRHMSFHAYISFSTRFLNMSPFFIFYLMIHMQDKYTNMPPWPFDDCPVPTQNSILTRSIRAKNLLDTLCWCAAKTTLTKIPITSLIK